MTGFAQGTVLSVAGTVVEAVKAGAIRHFFLVGGCDGARPGRNYYTDFVKAAPEDTVVLTLACGKYRYDDPELVAMKDAASLRCAKLSAVDPLDAAGREAAAQPLSSTSINVASVATKPPSGSSSPAAPIA